MNPVLGPRPQGYPGGASYARAAAPHRVHTGVLPGGERRPSRQDLPRGRHPVPWRPELRRLPVAERPAAGVIVRLRGPCSSSRTSRAATSTSCGRRRCRGRPSCSVACWLRRRRLPHLRPHRGRRPALRRSGGQRGARLRAPPRAGVGLGGCVLWVHAGHRPEDRQCGRHPVGVARVLPAAVPDALRSLILRDLAWATIGWGFGVVAVSAVAMVVANVRAIRAYD